jgi:hypothetical protein
MLFTLKRKFDQIFRKKKYEETLREEAKLREALQSVRHTAMMHPSYGRCPFPQND